MPAAYMEASLSTTYEYDALGQLTRINDPKAGMTWTYTCDQGGNILKKNGCAYTTGPFPTGTDDWTYTYGDPNWKDKLTAYCGMPITYDGIGNPLSYNGWNYTWKAGRVLHSMVGNGVNAQFTYDHTGLRVKKTVNGVDTLYTLNGKKITHIRKGTTQMHFFYDAHGRPSIIRYNGVDYTYMHNLQGDIVAIVDQEGRSVVEYSYDAWGRPVYSNLGKICTGSMADTLGVDNPFRYRGYVYDEETGLYYLQSRYYDPEWGRFLNADILLGSLGSLYSHNLYAYCINDPISYIDTNGQEIENPFSPTKKIDIFIFGRNEEVRMDGFRWRIDFDPDLNDQPHVHVYPEESGHPGDPSWKQKLDGTPYDPNHPDTLPGKPPKWMRDRMAKGDKNGKKKWKWREPPAPSKNNESISIPSQAIIRLPYPEQSPTTQRVTAGSSVNWWGVVGAALLIGGAAILAAPTGGLSLLLVF